MHKTEGFHRKKSGARERLEKEKEGVFLDKTSSGRKGPARAPILQTVSSFSGTWRRPRDTLLIGVDQKVPDRLIKTVFQGEGETAAGEVLNLGLVLEALHISGTIWGLWFSLSHDLTGLQQGRPGGSDVGDGGGWGP